jgi:meckelin
MQCKTEMFFIDWEHSRAPAMAPSPTRNGLPNELPAPVVSVWRNIFMCNEWARLQTYRRVNIEFTLLCVLLLLQALNLRNLGTLKPDLGDLANGIMNPILLFAAVSFCWVIIVIAQVLFKNIIYDRFFSNRLYQFVDVLSLANTSLVLFDEPYHGYYVHGRSVHPTADTDIEELKRCLEKEAVININ